MKEKIIQSERKMNMQTVVNLLNAESNKKLGNHRVNFVGNRREFVYFQTNICVVNDEKKIFIIDDSYGSVSTKRACNSYRNELERRGYVEK